MEMTSQYLPKAKPLEDRNQKYRALMQEQF